MINEVKWGCGEREKLSASVHEDKKWYCISVEHVIFFFIIITIYYYYLKKLKLINGIVSGIVFIL
jgi:hypothetical protein